MIENIEIVDIIERAKRYESVVLYGAGMVADELSRVLSGEGINIKAVVVSQKKNVDALNGIPVYAVDEYRNNITDNILVIVAVSRKYRDELVERLDDLQIREYICASDYLMDKMSNEVLAVYDKEACERWWKGEQILAKYLSSIDLNKGKSHAQNGATNIVLASGSFVKPKTVKMVRALSRNGYKVHLLIYKSNINDPLGAVVALEGSGVYIEYVRSAAEIVSYCMNCNVRLLHILSESFSIRFFKDLIVKKLLLPPIVFEMYDIMNGLYTPSYASDNAMGSIYAVERFCFENADGVCAREFSMDYVEKKCKIKFPVKRLVFLDYYNRDDEVSDEGNDGELSLCYVGGVTIERERSGMSLACFLDMADLCERNRCHLYLYPSRWNEEQLSDYIRLDKKSEYFHLCKPVAFESLCREISKYDYGIQPVRRDFESKEVDVNYFKEKYYYAGTNKYFDYLQSGLPVVSGIPVMLMEMLESEGMAINWCLEDFDFDELRRRKHEMKENVRKNRHKFSMQERIGELMEFYEDLIK